METHILFDPKAAVTSVVAKGISREGQGLQLMKEAVKAAKENNSYKIFYDLRGIVLEASILAIYRLPPRAEKEDIPRGMQMAFLYSRDEGKYTFLETVARNNGFNMRVFKSRDDAMMWLSGN